MSTDDTYDPNEAAAEAPADAPAELSDDQLEDVAGGQSGWNGDGWNGDIWNGG